MPLSDRKHQLEQCIRCSLCKTITTPRISGASFSSGCPSIDYGNFHAYCAGGRNQIALALEEGKIGYTDTLLNATYTCTMCGNCQISCNLNYGGNVEPLENMQRLRRKCVQDGQGDPVHATLMTYLKREDNIFGKPKSDRVKWTDGLKVKDALEEKTAVYLHVGCHLSYDEELWPIIRGVATILGEAGVDFGICKKEEGCCGGRSYEMGYNMEPISFAESLIGRIKEAGSKTLVTACSDCYGTFRQIYPKLGQEFKNIEVLHITEFIDRLIKSKAIKFTKEVPLHVTYHDPCKLGRLGEYLKPWHGEIKLSEVPYLFYNEPAKDVNFGVGGVYDAPRNILRSIPGIKLTEMPRIREWAYCCGAGGGAKEAFPEFAHATASERLREAKSTAAEALVTACPWCERNFKDAIMDGAENIGIFDIIELVLKGMGKTKN